MLAAADAIVALGVAFCSKLSTLYDDMEKNSLSLLSHKTLFIMTIDIGIYNDIQVTHAKRKRSAYKHVSFIVLLHCMFLVRGQVSHVIVLG